MQTPDEVLLDVDVVAIVALGGMSEYVLLRKLQDNDFQS